MSQLFFTHTATSFWYATLRSVPIHVCTQYNACTPFDIYSVNYAPGKHVEQKSYNLIFQP